MPDFSKLRSALILALLGSALAVPAAAEAPAGAYLAARLAGADNDYRAAAGYYAQLLQADPKSPEFAEVALMNQIILGDYAAAVPLAQAMGAPKEGSQIAAMMLLAEAGQREDFAGVVALLEAGADPGKLVAGLLRAWGLAGAGQMSEATKEFDALAKEQGLAAFAQYHKALALASVGDFEGADAIFAGPEGDAIRSSRRGVLAHVQILSQIERAPDAVALIDAVFGPDLDPELTEIRARLAAGEALPFTVVSSARDGMAEVFYSLASVLASDAPDPFTLVQARLATYLRADHTDAILLTASLFQAQGRYDMAIETYAQIPTTSPAFPAAELGRADAMVRDERTEAAIEVLEKLTRTNPDLGGAWLTLGDTLRREKRFKEAVPAYDKAIALIESPSEGDWFTFYARGISEERSDAWDKAEADFRKALELSPDQPAVLNYLGYSYVEKKENLDEALGMIERAVKARPDEGYIVDSLGWALYRLGRYDEAVAQMERAVELEAVDPLVNDHLGDVYWAVGRKREAEFQWKRALSFGPGEELDMDRVRRKLEVGLDKVLADEGAAPLHPAK